MKLLFLLLIASSAHAQLTGIDGMGPRWHPHKHTKLDTCVGLTEDWQFDTIPAKKDSLYFLVTASAHPWLIYKTDTMQVFYPEVRFIRTPKYLYTMDSTGIISLYKNP